MNNKQTQLMAEAPVRKAILKLSIPVVCGMMVQVLYNLVDTFFIGKLGDGNQLAAANITTPVFMIMMAISTIVATGAASYISRCIGRNDEESANRTLSTGIGICLGLGVLVSLAGIIWLKPLVIALGASEQVYPFAYAYSLIMFIGAVPVMLNFCMGQLLRAEGAAMPSIIGMMVGTVVNVILDPIFIFVFSMGIQGAAIATVLGNVGALAFYIYYYASGKALLKIKLRWISKEKVIWKEIFFIGIPAALSQLLQSVALIILNNLAKGYGDNALAGMGISAKLMFIGTFIFMGFAAGCQPLIGYNYGAQNYPRVRSVFQNGMAMTMALGAVLTVLFWIFASSLVSVFTPLTAVVEQGTTVLRISMFSFLVLGPQMLATTGIQALGKAKESLLLSVARQGLFYIPLLFLLRSLLDFRGLIWAQPLADVITMSLGILLLVRILRKAMQEPLPQTPAPDLSDCPQDVQ